MVLSLWVALTVIFVAVTQLPGDPVRALFGFKAPPPEIYAAIRTQFHLDEPLWRQYLLYLKGVMAGDFGNSYPLDPYGTATVGTAVTDTLASAMPVSGILLLGALIVQMTVGVLLGALSARRKAGVTGSVLYALALLLVSAPVLVAAYTLRTVFGSELGWLPARGLFAGPVSYVLPILALSALSTGYVVLLTRSEVQETLGAAYIQAAHGRGLSPSRILLKHALQPSLIPVVAFILGNVGQLFVGLIIVEGVFDLPGVGAAILQAIANQDRSLLIGLVTIVMVVVIVANAVADVLVAAIDPRVRLTHSAGS
jgi:ABC-type dipeptide/oligopeptide/nickel transport system permease component